MSHAESHSFGNTGRQLSPVEKYQTILRVSDVILSSSSPQSLFSSIAHVFRESFPLDCVAITIYEAERNVFNTVAIEPFDSSVELYSGFEVPHDGSHSGWVYDRGELLIADDIEKQQRFATDAIMLEQGLRSYVVVPLRTGGGEIIGTFNVGSRYPGRYRHADLEFLNLIAQQLAMGVDNVRRHELMSARRTELESAQGQTTEKDQATHETLSRMEEERRNYRHTICRDVREAVAPVIARLRRETPPERTSVVDGLELQLQARFDRDIDVFRDRLASLTSRELDVARLIRTGLSSKEIAERLNVALVTVHTHRENLRRKLRIRGKPVGLRSYLESVLPPSP